MFIIVLDGVSVSVGIDVCAGVGLFIIEVDDVGMFLILAGMLVLALCSLSDSLAWCWPVGHCTGWCWC